MGDVVDFIERRANLPSTIYAVKVSGKDSYGKKFSRINFFALKSDYDAIMANLNQYPDGITIKTYEGKVEWTS